MNEVTERVNKRATYGHSIQVRTEFNLKASPSTQKTIDTDGAR